MIVYIVSALDDVYLLPCAFFYTLRECACFIGVTLDHLKHCKCGCEKRVYCTKDFIVEGVVI